MRRHKLGVNCVDCPYCGKWMNLKDFISKVIGQMEEGVMESTFEICIAPSEGDILVVPEGQHSGKLKFTVRRK